MSVLLDTHAVVWLANRAPMRAESIVAIDAAAARGEAYVSPISAWEIGMLVAKGRVRLSTEPMAWFEAFLSRPGVRLAPLAPVAAIAASFLPDQPPRDPADRLLVATARHLDAVLVTRDAEMHAYAAAGHIKVLAC